MKWKGFSLISILIFASPITAKPKACCQNLPSRFAANSDMVKIPAGTFMMGGNNKQAKADELPRHQVNLGQFWIDKTQVTNSQFSEFVKATKYQTTAERKPDWNELKKQLPPGTPKPDENKLVAASLIFTPPNHPILLENVSEWWSWTAQANWKHPHGANSNLNQLENHPVVHVSWQDANAYCKWKGKRLPSEAEWEWAARGGLKDKLYPWGNEAIDSGTVKANTWQGKFPVQNTLRDKYYYTSPVKSYPPNGYGLYDMAGNVWEWVADWYRADYYQSLANKTVSNPQGPEKSFDADEPYAEKKTLRGGSFLCNEVYCSGYRVSARMKSTMDTSMEHTGFRCAR